MVGWGDLLLLSGMRRMMGSSSSVDVGGRCVCLFGSGFLDCLGCDGGGGGDSEAWLEVFGLVLVGVGVFGRC